MKSTLELTPADERSLRLEIPEWESWVDDINHSIRRRDQARLISPTTACNRYGISFHDVLAWAAEGRLGRVVRRRGGRGEILLDPAAIETFLSNRTATP